MPTGAAMKYRKLRIAFSVTCGIACVLLVVLWVRSYRFQDRCYGNIPGTTFIAAGSQLGYLYAIFNDEPRRDWVSRTTPLPNEAWRKVYRENEPTKAPNRFLLGIYFSPPYATLCVPYWLLVLLSTLLAAAPWLRWSNRFSLRTLLIAMTLVAVVLGIGVWLAS
jgi:hypothetical protein